MGRSNVLSLLSLLLISYSVSSQSFYLCYFKDKPHASIALESPTTFLSAASIRRRDLNSVMLSNQDVPVYIPYLDSLLNKGAQIVLTSRWLNAAFVTLDSASQLNNVSVLDDVVLVSDLKKKNTAFARKSSDKLGDVFEGYRNENTPLSMFTGKGIKIALFDAGYEGAEKSESLIDSDQRTVEEYNLVIPNTSVYSKSKHGYQVFSRIEEQAAKADIQLYVTESVDYESRIEEVFWLKAAEMADSAGVHIINSSVGYNIEHDNPSEDYSYSDMDGETTIVSIAASIAVSKGMLVVASSGNDAETGNWQTVIAPADVKDVLSVGAVNRQGKRSSFSSFGITAGGVLKPDVMAMGEQVTFIDSNTGDTYTENGTSFSSPVISGIAASLLQLDTTLTVEELRTLIIESASLFPMKTDEMGYGIVDGQLLLQQVLGSATLLSDVGIVQTASNELILFNPNEYHVELLIYTLEGKLFLKKSFESSTKTISLGDNLPHFFITEIIADNSSEIIKLQVF